MMEKYFIRKSAKKNLLNADESNPVRYLYVVEVCFENQLHYHDHKHYLRSVSADERDKDKRCNGK